MILDPVETLPTLRQLEFRSGSAPTWIDEDRLAIIDKDAAQIVTFDLGSGHATRIGRRGSGPGELTLPMWILAREGGDLLVGDGLAMRATAYGPDGRVRNSAQIPGRPLGLLSWNGSRVNAVWMEGLDPVVGTVDLETGQDSVTYRPYSISPGLVESGMKTPAGPTPFLITGVDTRGRALLGGGKEYSIYSFAEDGSPATIFARPELPPELMSDEEFEEHAENLNRIFRAMGPEGMKGNDEILREARARPKLFFRMGGLSMDEQGRLWVVTSHRTSTATAVDVFSADGAFLTRLDIPGKVVSVRPRLPLVAVLREGVGGDADGFEGIDLYRVIENE